MAGGASEVKVPKGLFVLIGLLWMLIILVGVFLYASHRFVLYLDTLPQGQTSLHKTMLITSPAFNDGELIPALYTCDAKQVSPPLIFSKVPNSTESFVVMMTDIDAPTELVPSGEYVHWSVFNIPQGTTAIETGEVVGVLGASGNGVAGYVGPCPPREYEPREHRYVISVYALDTTLPLVEGTSIEDIRAALDGHIIDHATLTGRYERAGE